MTISLKHKKQSNKAEGTDPNKIRTSNWNDEHDITLAQDKVIGRSSSGTGPAEEITVTPVARSLLDDTTFPEMRSTLELVGQQAIWLPAGALTPTTTSGAASGKTETTTNKVNFNYLAFDAAAIEKAQALVQMPKSWDGGTVIAQFIWSQPAGTGAVVWGAKAVAFANDDTLDAAFGSAQVATTTGGTANDVYFSAETTGITIAGSPGADAEELVCFEFTREATNGSDTLTVDAWLIGVKLHYTTDAARED